MPVEEAGRCPLVPVGNGVQRAGGPRQFQEFLRDAVHVHGERDAAEADERDAKFFFVQGSRPE